MSSVFLVLLFSVNDDFTDSMAVLQFNINSDNPRRVFYTINGDTIDEPDETIVFQLSGPSGVALIPDRSTAVVTIINDDSEMVTSILFTAPLVWSWVLHNLA